MLPIVKYDYSSNPYYIGSKNAHRAARPTPPKMCFHFGPKTDKTNSQAHPSFDMQELLELYLEEA